MRAEGEIEREARRVLPRLLAPGAVIRRVGDGEAAVYAARNRFRKPLLTFAAEMLHVFLKRDLVRLVSPGSQGGDSDRPDGGPAYEISAAGTAFVRRLTAGRDPFAAQHRHMGARFIDEPGRAGRLFQVNEGESPIGWLRRRKGADGRPLIGEAAFRAAEKLRADFTLAHLGPRVTAIWSAAPGMGAGRNGAGGPAITEAALAARQRVRRALDAAGPGLADALIEICCHLNGLEEAERHLGWPRRAGKLVLTLALDRLAAHYGFAKPEAASGRIRAWTAE